MAIADEPIVGWDQAVLSKIAFEGFYETFMEFFTFSKNNYIHKICRNTKFKYKNTFYFHVMKGHTMEDWDQVPNSKNSFWGHFLTC